MEAKKRWGDRKDAVLIRDIDPMHSYMAYLMPNRTDSEVYMRCEVDVTDLMEYIKEKNQERERRITVFHAVIYAVSKIVRERPKLNRYISGKRFFQRRQISLSFVAKKRFTDHAEEALMILHPNGDKTLHNFTDKIVGDVHQARSEADNYGADSVLRILQRMPRFVMAGIMALFRFLDRRGKMFASVTDVDPNNTTVLLSNLGSIKCDEAYHHLNNYGTNSILITVGQMRSRMDENSKLRTILPLGITLDERIADGFYLQDP